MRISSANYFTLKSLVSNESRLRSKDRNEAADFFLKSVSQTSQQKAPIKIRQDDTDSTEEIKKRSQSTLGLGDQMGGMARIKSDLNVYEMYPGLSPSESSIASYTAEDSPSIAQMRKLRAAVEDVSKTYLRNNPTAEASELETELDGQFGQGFSEIIQVSINDFGSGRSELRIQQTHFSDLDNSEKEVFNRAIALAEDNFSSTELTRELRGSDISSQLADLERSLGPTSRPYVDDLRSRLSESEVDNELTQFKTDIETLFNLTSEQSSTLQNIVSSLQNLDTENIDTFNTEAFLDDLVIGFQSGRFAQATLSDDIETTGLLTEDS